MPSTLYFVRYLILMRYLPLTVKKRERAETARFPVCAGKTGRGSVLYQIFIVPTQSEKEKFRLTVFLHSFLLSLRWLFPYFREEVLADEFLKSP